MRTHHQPSCQAVCKWESSPRAVARRIGHGLTRASMEQARRGRGPRCALADHPTRRNCAAPAPRRPGAPVPRIIKCNRKVGHNGRWTCRAFWFEPPARSPNLISGDGHNMIDSDSANNGQNLVRNGSANGHNLVDSVSANGHDDDGSWACWGPGGVLLHSAGGPTSKFANAAMWGGPA